MTTDCLDRILAPLTAEAFLRHFTAREYFHVARNLPGYYSHLLTVADLDAVLQSQQLPAAVLNVVKDGVYVPVEEWSKVEERVRGCLQVAVPERLLSLYAAGSTLILARLNSALPALTDVCRTLSQELGFFTQTNIYVTPRDAAGFVKHADDHEVLILQVAGSKHWLLYPDGGPEVEIHLRTGDLLYIPRALFHAARAQEHDSVHITLGLRPPYAVDLIRDLATLVAGMPGFLQPMPPRFAADQAVRSFETDCRDRLRNLLLTLSPTALTDLRRDEMVSMQAQGWPGRLSDLRQVHLITTETTVHKRSGITTAVREDGYLVHVRFSDREVSIPLFLRSELRLVLGDSAFQVSDVQGMITDVGKIELIQEFVRSGLLQIVTI